MTSPSQHTARPLPVETRLRVQHLLDEGDQRFFAAHPGETMRRRMYFLGEKVEGNAEPARHVTVTRRADGTLTRRFTDRGDA